MEKRKAFLSLLLVFFLMVAMFSGCGQNQNDVIVYKTNTGAKYHIDGCSSLNKSKIPIKSTEAKAEGLTACARCHPPE